MYPHPSFFKFSDSLQPVVRQNIASPVKGFIIPLSHFDLQLRAGGFLGPRDGTIIVKSKTDRPLTSSVFTELVKRGQLGNRSTGTRYLQGIIDGLSQGDRSLVIGVHRESGQQALF